MITLNYQCDVCLRFDESTRDKCEAFPNIPREVLLGVVDHRESVEGDHGLRFLPPEGFKPTWGGTVKKHHPGGQDHNQLDHGRKKPRALTSEDLPMAQSGIPPGELVQEVAQQEWDILRNQADEENYARFGEDVAATRDYSRFLKGQTAKRLAERLEDDPEFIVNAWGMDMPARPGQSERLAWTFDGRIIGAKEVDTLATFNGDGAAYIPVTLADDRQALMEVWGWQHSDVRSSLFYQAPQPTPKVWVFNEGRTYADLVAARKDPNNTWYADMLTLHYRVTTRDLLLEGWKPMLAEAWDPANLPEDVADRVRERLVDGMIASWAESSADHNPTALALQRAVEEEFDLPPIGVVQNKDLREMVDNVYGRSGESMRSFVSAQYDETQQVLADTGIEEVVVFRGGKAVGALESGVENHPILMNPASSWSTDPEIAKNFVNVASMHNVAGNALPATSAFYSTVVPRERVLSTPFSGWGCEEEREFVLIGGLGETTVALADAEHAYSIRYLHDTLIESVQQGRVETRPEPIKDVFTKVAPCYLDEPPFDDWIKTALTLGTGRVDHLRGVVQKHYPGGHDHDQDKHGYRWSTDERYATEYRFSGATGAKLGDAVSVEVTWKDTEGGGVQRWGNFTIGQWVSARITRDELLGYSEDVEGRLLSVSADGFEIEVPGRGITRLRYALGHDYDAKVFQIHWDPNGLKPMETYRGVPVDMLKTALGQRLKYGPSESGETWGSPPTPTDHWVLAQVARNSPPAGEVLYRGTGGTYASGDSVDLSYAGASTQVRVARGFATRTDPVVLVFPPDAQAFDTVDFYRSINPEGTGGPIPYEDEHLVSGLFKVGVVEEVDGVRMVHLQNSLVRKHYPGGQDHDQRDHGKRKGTRSLPPLQEDGTPFTSIPYAGSKIRSAAEDIAYEDIKRWRADDGEETDDWWWHCDPQDLDAEDWKAYSVKRIAERLRADPRSEAGLASILGERGLVIDKRGRVISPEDAVSVEGFKGKWALDRTLPRRTGFDDSPTIVVARAQPEFKTATDQQAWLSRRFVEEVGPGESMVGKKFRIEVPTHGPETQVLEGVFVGGGMTTADGSTWMPQFAIGEDSRPATLDWWRTVSLSVEHEGEWKPLMGTVEEMGIKRRWYETGPVFPPTTKIGERLLFNTFGDVLYNRRGDYFPHGLSDRHELAVNAIIGEWQSTAGDSSALALAMQRAVADEFGVETVDRMGSVKREVDILYGKMGETGRAYVRAEYEQSQQVLKAAGVEDLWLWRGDTLHGVPLDNRDTPQVGTLMFPPRSPETPPMPMSNARVVGATIAANPATSWSTDRKTAEGFESHGKEPGDLPALFLSKFPASKVLAMPYSGRGCLDEEEVLAIGGALDAYATAGVQHQSVLETALLRSALSIKKIEFEERDVSRLKKVDRIPLDEDWIKKVPGYENSVVRKHYPGGQDHDQDRHGHGGHGQPNPVPGTTGNQSEPPPMNPADLPEGPRVSREAVEAAAITQEEREWLDAFYQRSANKDYTASDEEYAHYQAILDKGRKARKTWNQKMRYDLAMGRITQEEAEALGYRGNGGDIWKPMPDTLYHVTTAKTAVYESGALKSRDELGQESGKGLGGGESDTISFTDDPKMAEMIKTSLREMHQVQNRQLTVEDMERMAAAGEGASRPFGPVIEPGDKFMLEGLRVEQGMPQTLEEFISPDVFGRTPEGEGWYGLKPWTEGTREGVFLSFARPLTDSESQDFSVRTYNRFSALRQNAGGIEWPVFFSVDRFGMVDTPVADIDIITVHPVPGAQGYQMGGLGEWRSPTGDNVTVEIPEGEKLRKALIEKHYPGGKDHDQMRHGKKRGGGIRERLGQCYILSGRYVIDHEGTTLVHGSIQGMGNPRINHAWVIMASRRVYDPVLDEEFEPEVWKAVFNAVEVKRYDREQTMVTILRERHWGPWK